MRRAQFLFALAVAVVLTAAGCGDSTPQGSKAFCDAAEHYNNELQRQEKKGQIDIPGQSARVDDLARTAPKAIRADAQRFADAMHQVTSDPSIKDDPAVKNAVDAVNRYANQACGVYSGGDSGI
jgi:hypothetical protein